MMQSSTALRTHRFLTRLALAGATTFSWISVFQLLLLISGNLPDAIARTALLYALSQTINILLTPYAAVRLRHGVREGMILGCLWAAGAFTVLVATYGGFLGNYMLGIVIFAILLGAYRAYYRIPYAVENALSGSIPHPISEEIVLAVVPFCAALIVSYYSIALLLFLASACIALGMIPMPFIPDVPERFAWSYLQSFGELTAHEHRATLIHGIVGGVQSATLFLLWPIALFLIFGWSYLSIGFIFSLTILFVLIVRLFISRHEVHLSRGVRSVLAASSWIARISIVSAPAAAIVDTYLFALPHSSAHGEPLTRDPQSDNGHYIDEHTALKEMSNALGRILVCATVAAAAMIVTPAQLFMGLFIVVALFAGVEALEGGSPQRHVA